LLEARRNLPQFLAETDVLIAEARGNVDPVQKIRSLLPEHLEERSAFEVVEENTRVPAYVETAADQWTENPDFLKLMDLVKAKQEGSYKQPRTKEDLLQLAERLKQPARATIALWDRHLSALMESACVEHIGEITEEHVLEFRNEQLETIVASSLKTKLRYIRALLELAKDQKWIDTNPANGATKHLVSKQKLKQVVRLDQADLHWQELPEPQHLLWHLCRWTGAHVSEVAGLRGCDIDLKEDVIRITPTEERPLKNIYRERVIPIHNNLRPHLKALSEAKLQSTELLLPWAYNADRDRWCEGVSWKRKLGITPKGTRDWAASCLRGKDINERVIGKLFGHSPSKESVTGVYGSADMDALRRAITMLE